MDSVYTYKKVTWASDSVGYCVASQGLSSSLAYALLRTQDGGHTWREIYTFQSEVRFNGKLERYALFDVHFMDEKTGIILCSQRIAEDDYALIRKTTDGGTTWTTVQQETELRSEVNPTELISFYSGSGGYLMTTKAELFRTTDAGNTWSYVGRFGDNVFQLQFTSEKIGYLISKSWLIPADPEYRFRKTTDGGATWKLMNDNVQTGIAPIAPYSPIYYSLYFLNDSVGFFTGSHPGFVESTVLGSNYVLRTVNGGFSWTRDRRNGRFNFDSAAFIGMHFLNSEVGWGIGGAAWNTIWHRECLRDSSFIRNHGADVFNEGDSTLLSLPEYSQPVRYSWSTGDTTRSIVAKDFGRYVGRVDYPGGCAAIDTVFLNVRSALHRDAWRAVLCRDCSILEAGADGNKPVTAAGCETDFRTYRDSLKNGDRFSSPQPRTPLSSVVVDRQGTVFAAGVQGGTRPCSIGAIPVELSLGCAPQETVLPRNFLTSPLLRTAPCGMHIWVRGAVTSRRCSLKE